MEMIQKLDSANNLDAKTSEIAHLAVLSATKNFTGLLYHVKNAKSLGTSRDEIASAILLGLPVIGSCVIQALPVALKSYDED